MDQHPPEPSSDAGPEKAPPPLPPDARPDPTPPEPREAPSGRLDAPPPQLPVWPGPASGPRPSSWPAPSPGVALIIPGTLVRGEEVLVPAGLWWRIGAFLIDFVILGLFARLLAYIVGIPEPDMDQVLKVMTQMLSEAMAQGWPSQHTLDGYYALLRPLQFAGYLNIALCAAYFTIFNGLVGGTLGKLSLGLRVLRRDGAPLGLGLAFGRYLLYLVAAKLAYTAWLIPFVRERQTLYDVLLKANVFRVERHPRSEPDSLVG